MEAPTSFFEGFEKRLDVSFQPRGFADGSGLRKIDEEVLGKLLGKAKCKIVDDAAVISNEVVSCYLLSESSMFIFPYQIVFKTCGTTTLLNLVPALIEEATKLSLNVKGVTYTRGTFMFPTLQAEPHRSFHEETEALDRCFGELGSANRHSVVLGEYPGKKWHFYTSGKPNDKLTLEVCMTGISPGKAAVFNTGKFQTATDMTTHSGISKIFPQSQISALAFAPCGYSMNAVRDSAVSTIHVTPQLDFSFASFESHGLDLTIAEINHLLQTVLACFTPREFSVAVYGRVGLQSNSLNVEVEDYTLASSASSDLGSEARVFFYNFCRGGEGSKTRL